MPWVDVATGSLGQGLPDGVAVALAGKYLDHLPYRVWVLCGNSEMAEDSIWEALDRASRYQLDNLVAIVDVNRPGSARLQDFLLHLRRVPHPRVRLHPHGRHLTGRPAAGRLPRRRRDRRGRPFTDGSRRPRDDGIRPRQHCALSSGWHSTVALVDAMADRAGISYMRTTRGAYSVLYSPDETFSIGGSKTLRSSDADQVTIAAAGITVHEALRAADALASSGIHARVIDVYSIKPIDANTLVETVQATSGRIVIAEDHRPEGGFGAADHIAAAARRLVGS